MGAERELKILETREGKQQYNFRGVRNIYLNDASTAASAASLLARSCFTAPWSSVTAAAALGTFSCTAVTSDAITGSCSAFAASSSKIECPLCCVTAHCKHAAIPQSPQYTLIGWSGCFQHMASGIAAAVLASGEASCSSMGTRVCVLNFPLSG